MTNRTAFARGFIKAAVAKNMALEDFAEVIKTALARPDELNYNDVARIKKEMSLQGADVPYDDPTGEGRRAYNAELLRKRDDSADEIPAISGGIAGLKSGLIGAGIGGAAGTGAGEAIKHTGLINLPFKYKKHMPVALGASTAALAGILSSLPAAKQRYEASLALKKLEYTKNMRDLNRTNNADIRLVNSM